MTGTIGPEREFSGDDLRRGNPRFSLSNREKVARLMAAMGPIAERHDATLAQTVIAWTVQQPGITFSLCGARDRQQAEENAAAGRIRLSAEEISEIEAQAHTHLAGLDT